MIDSLGPYQFEDVLGRGGMGTVYRGIHEDTQETHAVKVLAPQFADDDHFRSRFESEIKAMMKLDHPNIVRLLSFGQESGNLYFSMELVEGKSLFDMQRAGHHFTWPECLNIAVDVCRGLKHAHDRGIIHRDLKPGNLLLTTQRLVKITDFGIAKSYGGSHHTGTNILGTMDFMAPEQAKGETVTARSDIYALGTVLFTLMSGKPPFTANSMEEAFRNLTRVPVPKISTRVANVPPEVESLLAKMMEKRPDKRIATAQATLYKILGLQETLKVESEAKTAAHPAGRAPKKTQILAAPKNLTAPFSRDRDEKTRVGEQDGQDAKQPKTKLSVDLLKTISDKTSVDAIPVDDRSKHAKRKKKRAANKTLKSKPRRRVGKKTAEIGEDYFTPVTDEHRKAVGEVEELPDSPSRIWPIAILLATCLVAAVAGTWAAIGNPSADTLYQKIQRENQTPENVIDETKLFMELYAEDERFEEVVLLNEVGTSINQYTSLVKRLSVRARIPGDARGLTEIEDQFLKIVYLGDTQPTVADAKMQAFVKVHSNSEGLTERDQACIDAAKGFRIKIVGAEGRQVDRHVQSINIALSKAKSLPKSEASELYASLIKLYIDDDWGQRDKERVLLLRRVKSLLANQADALQADAAPGTVEDKESGDDSAEQSGTAQDGTLP